MEEVEIAERFVKERERLGYSQSSFARLLGVKRDALGRPENALTDFKSTILSRASKLGMDVQYVLTGIRSENADKAINKQEAQIFSISGDIHGVGVAQGGATVNIVNTQHHVTRVKAETKPGEEHITVDQRSKLTKLVDEIVKAEGLLKKAPKSHRAVWAALNAHCRVNTYTLIPIGDFEKASNFLHQWIGRLSSSASAPVKDGDNWRKRHYAYIKINSKDPVDAEAVASYMARKFKADSLTDLSNDELEAVYRYVAGRRNKRK